MRPGGPGVNLGELVAVSVGYLLAVIVEDRTSVRDAVRALDNLIAVTVENPMPVIFKEPRDQSR